MMKDDELIVILRTKAQGLEFSLRWLILEVLRRFETKLREQEQGKEPLTMEELCQMNGEPAYCAEYDEWGIVNVEIAGRWKGRPFLGGYSRGISFNYDIKMRGLTLYRHKPKECADHE